jgi:hypothetical protein
MQNPLIFGLRLAKEGAIPQPGVWKTLKELRVIGTYENMEDAGHNLESFLSVAPNTKQVWIAADDPEHPNGKRYKGKVWIDLLHP